MEELDFTNIMTDPDDISSLFGEDSEETVETQETEEKEEKEEERFLDLDFTNIEALRKESEIVCEALKAEEK